MSSYTSAFASTTTTTTLPSNSKTEVNFDSNGVKEPSKNNQNFYTGLDYTPHMTIHQYLEIEPYLSDPVWKVTDSDKWNLELHSKEQQSNSQQHHSKIVYRPMYATIESTTTIATIAT